MSNWPRVHPEAATSGLFAHWLHLCQCAGELHLSLLPPKADDRGAGHGKSTSAKRWRSGPHPRRPPTPQARCARSRTCGKGEGHLRFLRPAPARIFAMTVRAGGADIVAVQSRMAAVAPLCAQGTQQCGFTRPVRPNDRRDLPGAGAKLTPDSGANRAQREESSTFSTSDP